MIRNVPFSHIVVRMRKYHHRHYLQQQSLYLTHVILRLIIRLNHDKMINHRLLIRADRQIMLAPKTVEMIPSIPFTPRLAIT